MNAFPPPLAAPLRQLATLWPHDSFLVVGAAALGCHIEMTWRRTEDLDLAVGASLDKIKEDLESTLGWVRDPRLLHRWRTGEGIRIDIIPITPEALKTGEFRWPDGSAVLSLSGFRLAFQDPEIMDLGDGIQIRVASLPSLVVLKVNSFLERPAERRRDLEDLVHLISEYLPFDALERWAPDIIDLQLDYDDVPGYLLGRRIAALVDQVERRALERFFSEFTQKPFDSLMKGFFAAG